MSDREPAADMWREAIAAHNRDSGVSIAGRVRRPRIDMLAVRCDDCGAGPGEPCYDLRGAKSEALRTVQPHWIRQNDARAAGHEVAS